MIINEKKYIIKLGKETIVIFFATRDNAEKIYDSFAVSLPYKDVMKPLTLTEV